MTQRKYVPKNIFSGVQFCCILSLNLCYTVSSKLYVSYIHAGQLLFFLMHSADPRSQPVVIIIFEHVRPFRFFERLQNKTNFQIMQCWLLVRLWGRPRGSLKIHVLFQLLFLCFYGPSRLKEDYYKLTGFRPNENLILIVFGTIICSFFAFSITFHFRDEVYNEPIPMWAQGLGWFLLLAITIQVRNNHFSASNTYAEFQRSCVAFVFFICLSQIHV